MGASWDVLKRDEELLLFPLLSGVCCLFVLASFAFYAATVLNVILLAVVDAAVGVLYLSALALVQSALQSIFQAALYLHARHTLDPAHYPDHLLSDSLNRRS
jgi:hypothetical protein